MSKLLLSLFGGVMPSPWLIIAAGVALIVSFGGGAYAGHHYGWLEQRSAVVGAQEKVIAKKDEQAAVTETAGQAAAEKQVVIQTVYKTIVKKVPVYVTQEADARCAVPLGFVQLHDAAANGVPLVPEPARQSDGSAPNLDAPSGVALSAVASTVAENYGTYHQVVQQLLDLQDWVRQQQAIGAKP